MKIRDVAIDGFGTWTDLQLVGMHDGVNVVYGQNEAGKTTLMQFLRTALYGFSPDRIARYLPPVHGGSAGGAIVIESPEGQLVVRRHFVATVGTPGAEVLQVTSPDGSLRDHRLLADLLGNVDEAVFRNVFAIGMREIQELGALSDTAAAGWLYRLATGLDRVSLVDVLRELATARERIVAAGREGSTAGQLLPVREKLRRQVNDPQPVRQFVELGQRCRDLLAQLAAWDVEAAELEHAARLTELAAQVHQRWHQRQAAQSELTEAQQRPRAEASMLEHYESIAAKIERGKRALKALARERTECLAQITALGENEALSRQAARVEGILDQEQWITTLDKERRTLAEQLANGEAELKRLSTELGIVPGAARTDARPMTAGTWQRLAPVARQVRAARRKLAEATAQQQQLDQAAQAAAGKLTSSLISRNAKELAPLLERAGQTVSQLRNRVQVDERLAEMSRRKTEVTERSRDLLDRQLLSGRSLIALGTLFVVGVAAVLAGLLMPAWLFGGLGHTVAVVGGLAAVGAGATKFIVERSRSQQSDEALTQLDTLEQQLLEAQSQRDALDKQLPPGGGPLLMRLQAAEKELAAVEALVPLETDRQTAAQKAAASRERIEQAEADYRLRRRRWRQALESFGLPKETSPARAKHLAHDRHDLAELERRLSVDRAELSRRQQAIEAFRGRLRQLLAELNLPPTEQGFAEQFQLLGEQLRAHGTLAAQRATIDARLRRLRHQRNQFRLRLDRGRRQLSVLLHRAGVVDIAELRRRVQDSALCVQLAQRCETLSLEIAGVLGTHTSEEELAPMVSEHTREALDDRWLAQSSEAQKLRDKIRSAHEQLGRARQQSQSLVEDRRRGETLIRLADAERQLREAAQRWRVLAATEWFLKRVRHTYERERQPESLRSASHYLASLTDGRYVRVWTPLEEDVLRVDDAQGRSLPVEVLSRGTREQLFLSLRLALVESYARRGVDLPLVLDDVLVNFDARRASAAVRVMREFADDGHQLVVFTCHEHVYRQFCAAGAAACELPSGPRAAGKHSHRLEFSIASHEDVPVAPARPLVIEPSEADEHLGNGAVSAVVTELAEPEPLTFAPEYFAPETIEVVVNFPDIAPPPIVEHAAPEPAPPVVENGQQPQRVLVKYDALHTPRGPFATALWQKRVAEELTGFDEQRPYQNKSDGEPVLDLDPWRPKVDDPERPKADEPLRPNVDELWRPMVDNPWRSKSDERDPAKPQ